MKKWLFYIAAALTAASCIYPYDPDINTSVDKTVVVDGEILVGGTSTIRLNYLTDLKQTTSLMRPKGKAWIEDEDGARYEASTSALTSTIQIPMTEALPGKQYRAVIEVDGETYTSQWLDADPAPVIENVYFVADEKNVTVYVDVNAQESESGYVGFSYEETWEFHADFIPEQIVNPQSWTFTMLMADWPYYWCYRSYIAPQRVLLDYTSMSSQTDRFPITAFSRTDNRNHKRYSILVRAYALSRDAYLYNKQTQEMSDVGGSLFTPDPGQLKSNLVCDSTPERKVMGLVLAAEVSSKRVFMNGTYYISTRPSTASFVIPDPSDYSKYYYDMNYRPVMTTAVGEATGLAWGPHRCTNCLEGGGTQERPEFWED